MAVAARMRHGRDTLLDRLELGRASISPGGTADLSAAERAVDWLRAGELPGGGIRVHDRHLHAYQEVTGYLIPSLLDVGARDLACRCAEWLIAVQRESGAFVDPDRGEPYVFDTGQALRGLLAARDIVPGAARAAARAAHYLCRSLREGGAGGFPEAYRGSVAAEPIQLYALSPLARYAELAGDRDVREAAARAVAHYLKHPDLLRIGDLTHFLVYQVEALIELGMADRAAGTLAMLGQAQVADGSVRATGAGAWVCLPGLAQLAICWYRTGDPSRADRALAWLERHQRPSGGWRGSHGFGATYFPRRELSWAVKFFLDAARRREIAWRRAYAPEGALGAIGHLPTGPLGRLAIIGDRTNVLARAARVVLADCAIESVEFPIDDSPPFVLSARPEFLPLADRAADAVLVASLAHALDRRAAIREVTRIVRPGGSIVVLGDAPIETWLGDRCAIERRVQLPQGQTVTVARRVERDRMTLASTSAATTAAAPAPGAIDVDAIRFGRVAPVIRRLICLVEPAPGRSVLVVGDPGSHLPLHLARQGARVILEAGRATSALLDACRALDLPATAFAVSTGADASPQDEGSIDAIVAVDPSADLFAAGSVVAAALARHPVPRLIVALPLSADVTGSQRVRLDSGLPMSTLLSWFGKIAPAPEIEVIAAHSMHGEERSGPHWLIASGPPVPGPMST